MDSNSFEEKDFDPTQYPKLLEMMQKVKQNKMRRRQIRYRLFRIRENNPNYLDDGLKEYIEHQLNPNIQQNWETFTFTWDVGVDDPFKVIVKEEWVQSGGKYDEMGERVPPAFTEQGVNKPAEENE